VKPSEFTIRHNMVIYDNVTAFYNWRGSEIAGVELYNQAIADTHRQLFEMLWNAAKPVDDLRGDILE
jgi:hypothetical protein